MQWAGFSSQAVVCHPLVYKMAEVSSFSDTWQSDLTEEAGFLLFSQKAFLFSAA